MVVLLSPITVTFRPSVFITGSRKYSRYLSDRYLNFIAQDFPPFITPFQ